MKLWIDDLRTPPSGWTWAKTPDEAIDIINTSNKIDAISLDHDLGEDSDGQSLSTRPVLLFLIENEIPVGEVFVHTANPVGGQWLREMIDRYLC